MKILLFAGLADAVGRPSVEVDVTSPVKVKELKRLVAETHPAAKNGLETCFAAINQDYADDEAVVEANDEVAFIPPVSGG